MLNNLAKFLYRNVLQRKNGKLLITLILIPFSVNLFSQVYDIGNNNGQTINTCSGTFYDSGGPGSDYGNNENKTVTFCSNAGNSIQFNFTSFATAPGDNLFVYDGPNTSSPLLGTYTGGLAPFLIYSSGTCLTFNFISNASITTTGWAATISCICPPVVMSLINPTNDVCEGTMVNYYVADHVGSTYDWAVTNGTPATVTAGAYNQDITWNVSGVDKLGIISVTEKNFCGSTASKILFINIYSIPTITGTTPGSVCGTGTVTLEANASAGTVRWYDLSSGGTLLATGNTFTTPSISSTTTYYAEAYNNGCSSVTRTSVIATVFSIPTITSITPGSRCDAGTVILGAAASAGTVNWYDASTGGSFLGTGTTFTTPSISSTTTYYVDATDNGCTTGTRTAVIATIYTTPTITGTTPGSRCGTGTVNLSAAASAGTINWYDLPTGGSLLGTGASFTTPSISSTTTYYVDATSVLGGCTSTPRTSVVATVHPLPAVSFTGLNPQYDLSDPASILIGSPLGGTFSGPGIAGITFTPSSAGVGTHTIDYTYSDAFCTNISSQVTEVSNYDFKAGAKLLSSTANWCSANAQFSTVGATMDEIKGSCWANGPNYNRWFKFQATTTDIHIQLKTGGAEGTLQYPFLALFDASNTQISCATYSSQYSDIELVSSSLTPGQWYYIAVDNYIGAGYRGTFTLCADASVNYDLKAGAVTVPSINNWCSADAQYTTLGATGDQAKGSCWANGPNYNRWFKFQATATKVVSVRLKTGGAEGTLQYPFLALWRSDGTQIGCATYSGQYSDIEIMAEGLTENDWYYVSVDNYVGSGYCGTFSLCIDQNINYDLRAGAVDIPSINAWCSSDAAYTTVGATGDQSKGSCWANGPNYNRWFSFTATATGIALVQLKTGGAEGTLQYPFLALWNSAGVQVGCATYSSQYSDLAIVAEGLTSGQKYYISVDNYVGTGYCGTFTLCVDEKINYDLKDGATEVTSISNWCSPDAAYTTVGATGDEVKGSCWANGPNYNRWFKFKATSTKVASIKLKTGGAEGTLQYPFMALWDASGAQVGCATYSAQYSDIEIIAENLTDGAYYYISVDNYVGTGYCGTFSLCIDETINYDLKAGALTIPPIVNWCSADAAYTTVGATGDQNKGSCWSNGPNYNRWFRFQATATTVATVKLKTGGAEGTLQYPFLAVWKSDGTQIGCATYTSQYSDIDIALEGLITGDWYYISVDNYVGAGYCGTFTLCVDEKVDYDLKAGAVVIPSINNWCSSDAAYSTVDASADQNKGSCWANGPNYNRWFTFKATATTKVTIKLKTGGAEGTMQYPFMALWDAGGTQIGCATYSSQYSDIEIVAEGLTNGNWYYVSVDNYVGTGYSGSFTLCVDEQVDYDARAGAISIPSINNWCSSDAAYSTVGASGDQNKGSCWANGPNYNRWFQFQADASGIALIQLKTGGSFGTLQYPFIALWDASNTQLGCASYTSQYSGLEIIANSLTAGQWYYISVDNYVGTGYQGTFSLCVDNKLGYNFKDGAITLSDLNGWCSSNSEYTTVGATADQAKGSCWTNGPNYNRWFKFQATTANISVQVRTTNEEGTLRRPYVALWDASLAQVACKIYTTDNSDIEVTSTALTPGNWYYISVDNFTGTGYQGSFTLCATSAIPNDDKANAYTLTDLNSWCSADAKYTNSIATPDNPVGSCFGGGVNKKNVWFKFTALNPTVTVTVTTGGNFGTMSSQQIALFDVANTQLGCTAPIAGQGTSNLIVNGLTNGNTYWISVDDNNISGTFTLCVDDNNIYTYPPGTVELTDINNWCSPPANYTNVGSPADTKFGSCWGAGTYNNKWFKFQATTSEIKIDIKTGSGYGSMVRQQVALWNSTGSEVGCSHWSTNQGTVTLQSVSLTPGQWYYISVDDDNTSGTFSLCINKQVDYDFYDRALTVNTNWCSSDAAYDNTFATADKSQGSCWSGATNKNVWFKFIAAQTFMKISVKTGGGYGSMVRQQVALWDATGTNQIGCARWVNNQGTITLQTNSLVPTQTYYISVDDDNTPGTFSLCLTDIVDYDYYEGAQIVNTNWCSSDAAYDNTFATADKSQGSCWSGATNKNVWFKFIAAQTFMKISVKTGGGYGSMVRQQVALWDATGTNQIGCARWVNNQGTITLQTNSLVPTQTYYISVDDDNTPGTFSLCLTDIVDYDYRAGAIFLSNTNSWCSSDAAYDNTFATADETMGSCWSGATNKNVWFRFQPITNIAKISINTGTGYGSMQRQQFAVWDALNNQVGCAKWTSNQGILTLNLNTLIPGDDYWISVDDDLTPGSFSLCINTAPLSVNVTSTDVTCFGFNNGTATATPSGGVPPYSYLWTGPGSFASLNASISNLIPGNYNVKVTDNNGDFVNGSATITQPAASLSGSIIAQTNVSCTGGSDGSVSVQGAGGTIPYEYRLGAGAYQGSGTFSGLSAGSYTVTVRDNYGCTITVPVTITTLSDITPPSITCPGPVSVNTDPGLCNASVTLADPIATDNCSINTIIWTMTGATIASSPSTGINYIGTYLFNTGVTLITYTAKDASSNQASCNFSVTVTDNINPVIICPGPISVQCVADVPTIYANYAAFIGAGGSATDNCGINPATFIHVSDVSAGTCPSIISRTYQISDISGNISTCVQTINVNDTQAPTWTTPAGNLNRTVQCSDAAGLSAAQALAPVAADNCDLTLSPVKTAGSFVAGACPQAGTYTNTWTVSDDCGNAVAAVYTQVITVIDNTPPVVSGCPADISANNDAATCSAVVNWTAPTFTDNCSSPVVVASHNPGDTFPAGTTLVTYTATDNCGNSTTCTFNITVADNEIPVISCPSDITQAATLRQTTSAVIVPDATYSDNCTVSSVTWAMTGATSATSPAAGINMVGTYTFDEGITTVTYTATDGSGLSATCSFTVTITPSSLPLSGSITSQSNVDCFGSSSGSVTVSGSDGVTPYEYSLNGGSYQSSGTFGTLSEGVYTITIRDASLSTFDIHVTITQPGSAVSGTITSQTNVTCSGDNSGSIIISGSGGVAPYRYKIGTGSYQSNGTFEALAAGNYTIMIQDANLCMFNMQVTITEPSPITPSVTSQKNVSCNGASDGSVSIAASGGNAPYEYSIDGNAYQTSGKFNSLYVASYTITVRDVNMCTKNITVLITEPEVLTVSLTSTKASCHDQPDGNISISVTGGTNPYNYIWDDGISTYDRTNVIDGSYSVVVTDANGCATSANVEVGVTGSENCIIVQEIITPNNDGFNDTWKIKNIDLFPNAEVFVYTRWGKLVFKTKNLPANEWDGTFKGKLLPADSYHYILDLHNGSKKKSGVISIIR